MRHQKDLLHIRNPLQAYEGRVVEGNPQACGRIICTSAGADSERQMINYQIERVVGTGSFGVVFQAKCLETGETVGFAYMLDSELCHAPLRKQLGYATFRLVLHA